MIIKTLVENTSISEDFGSEHGLSLYIETKKHKILFDVGASDLFVKNAQKMNVNISDIDYLVISHGHNDHGGGLKTFFKYNNKAKVFINEKGFEKHYAQRKNGNLEFIGLNEELKQNKQIIFTGENFSISNGIEVFSNVVQKRPGPISNSTLFMKQNGILMNDTFSHEQNLVIEEDGKTLLVTGCAHNGIVNIMEHFYNLKKREPNYVIGGFHLSSRSLGSSERIETTQEIGKYLLKTDVKYYTCHCTGIESYKRLKDVMGEKIDYLSAGSELKI